MSTMRVAIEGIGLWSAQLADFVALRTLLDGGVPAAPAARPAAATLPPNERRRAPESVLLAAEVAGQAVAMSGRSAAELACVFSSSHGDQAITDYMCATLASSPDQLSPTRFHNSVHNAPAGYWTIASGCHAPSTAVCAHDLSFGAGLFEAVAQVLADQRAVLLVCSDIAGVGPLREVTTCTAPFGCALVLSPADRDAGLATLQVELARSTSRAAVALPAELDALRRDNASACALELLTALARGDRSAGAVRLSPHMELHMDMEYPA